MNALALALIVVAALAFVAVIYIVDAMSDRQQRQHTHEKDLADRRGELAPR